MRKFVPVLLILILLVVAGSIFAFTRSTSHKTYTVTLKQDGFHPKSIIINKGDKVTFSSTIGTPFWPASDIHPTHGIYPEFDPKQAIDKNATWTFQFDKIGSWGYHDHLAPYYMGKIIVK